MKILFVCTGNIFRSMIAEYSLKDYIKKYKIKGITVKSGGITARPQKVDNIISNRLNKLGIDISKHKQTRVTKNYLNKFDLIVVMSKTHKDFIKSKFNKESILFNKICYNKNSSVKDLEELNMSLIKQPLKGRRYIEKTIKHIYKSMPRLIKNYKKFLN